MTANPPSGSRTYERVITAVAILAAAMWTLQSWTRWANFSYTTFDLAFYVQALDGFSHGRNWSSLLGLRPFGNHADFVILLIWPIYALFQHPMVFIVVQSLALASCLPLGYRISRHAGWSAQSSFWLALVLLFNPVLTFVALHEFHPEAFAAPLWLAIYCSWQRRKLGWYWVFLVLLLSCKENLGLMLGAWCLVKSLEKPGWKEFWPWFGFPAILSALWLFAYVFWLGPKWNGGNVDFGALYSHLQNSGFLAGAFTILRRSLLGNLLWVLLLPMLLFPLRRPLGLLPALPILLQHLLSWRQSEWTVYFHYAAPLLPVFWIASLEGLEALRVTKWEKWKRFAPSCLVASNCFALLVLGTPGKFLEPWEKSTGDVFARRQMLARIPPGSSVVAPLPYQSHLAAREQLYSLHLILKGLKILSRLPYRAPPPTDYVLVDYADPITFDTASGYYHPAMKTKEGIIVPSSDVLLHQFLEKTSWRTDAVGSLTLFRKSSISNSGPSTAEIVGRPVLAQVVDTGTDLLAISALEAEGKWEIVSRWSFRGPRTKVPWMHLIAVDRASGERRAYVRGLVCPEGRSDGNIWTDTWKVNPLPTANAQKWELTAVFEDFSHRSYTGKASFVTEVQVPWSN